MDKHINFAQKLVDDKYKNIYGLKLTLTLHKSTKVPRSSEVYEKLSANHSL